MDWLSFAGSILGGLIGGLCTFAGVKLTLKHEKEKERREAIQKANETKPRLEIVNFRDFKDTIEDKTFNSDFNVLALHIKDFRDEDRARFFYNESALDIDGLYYVEYELKNTGLTEISQICITSNLPKNMSVMELEKRSFYIKENLLNYDGWANKRYIKSGETITLRCYFIKETIIESNLGNPLFTIWLQDVNERLWCQSLDCPYNRIEISQVGKRELLRDYLDVTKAIDSFRNPMLW